MTKRLVLAMLVACGSSTSTPTPIAGSAATTGGPAPAVAVNDHDVHTVETLEPGGTHLQITGNAIALEGIKLPAWLPFAVHGTIDLAVDLHVPSTAGTLDYRAATGEAMVRSASALTISRDLPATAGGSGVHLPPITVDHFEARAVFGNGGVDLMKWVFDSKDVRVAVTAHAVLAAALLESKATVCVRFASASERATPSSPLATTYAELGIAPDANGMWSLKLAGSLDLLAPLDYGCDGAERPTTTVADADPTLGITKIDDTHFEVTHVAIDKLLADPMAATKNARVVPAVKDGHPAGFKLYAIRPSSVFAKLGFLNGDTLDSVNGTTLSSVSDALDVFTKLRDAKTVEVVVSRRGAPVTLHYVIK